MSDSALEGVQVVTQSGVVGTYTSSDRSAFAAIPCGHCGATQQAVVAKRPASSTFWLRCVNCGRGSVADGGTVYPSAQPLREPKGLPDTDARIWREVRTCLGVGAYAAAVMLCRKLLFHIAVANGLPEKDDRDRAPTFFEAVESLEGAGVVTSKMRPWVDRIKDVGNDANHELTPITRDQALDVARFSEQLLVLAYELDALMTHPSGGVDGEVPVED